MRSASLISDFKRWQMVYVLKNYDVNAEFLSDISGYSKASIYSIIQKLNNDNSDDISIKKKGGRRREVMSIENERQFVSELKVKFENGNFIYSKDVKKILENKMNRKVSDDYIYDLFNRNGWKKGYHKKKRFDIDGNIYNKRSVYWQPIVT